MHWTYGNTSTAMMKGMSRGTTAQTRIANTSCRQIQCCSKTQVSTSTKYSKGMLLYKQIEKWVENSRLMLHLVTSFVNFPTRLSRGVHGVWTMHPKNVYEEKVVTKTSQKKPRILLWWVWLAWCSCYNSQMQSWLWLCYVEFKCRYEWWWKWSNMQERVYQFNFNFAMSFADETWSNGMQSYGCELLFCHELGLQIESWIGIFECFILPFMSHCSFLGKNIFVMPILWTM